MRTAIVITKAVIPCLVLGAISIICLANMGCKDIEPVQAKSIEETKMLTLEGINRELEFDIWCDTRKIEAVPHTDPEQYLITIRRQ